MLTLLRRPRWIAATVLVVAVCLVFAALGRWQLRRHEERKLANEVMSARMAAEPIDLLAALGAAGPDIGSLDFRPVTVTGVFDPADEVLLRSQVSDGRPGFDVVTPLTTEQGTVLVNRGWVPLAADTPPVTEVTPPAGTVTVSGLARKSQVRPSIGPVEPDGRLTVIARVDLIRLSTQFPDLLPAWVQETDPPVDVLPIRVPPPPTDDPGPHLPYAFQWFSFAVITAVGYGFLIRKALLTGE